MKPNHILELSRNRRSVDEVLAGITNPDPVASLEAGRRIVREAKEAGLSMRDYLRLSVKVDGEAKEAGLDGYEASLAHLVLPIANDFDAGIVLQAAAETFATFPGSRALFPEVVDDLVIWKYRQDEIEDVTPLISQSRTINGTELQTEVVNDNADDYQQFGMIAEGTNVPIRSIRMTKHGVEIFKFGGGYEWTYEFARRASLDIMTPYAARLQRETAIGQTHVAYSMLKNGDAVHGAAPVRNATDINTANSLGATLATGKMNWEIFVAWLVERAKAGVPIDTVTGGWDMYLQWVLMFAKPSIAEGMSQGDVLQKAGVTAAIDNPRFNFNVKFALASTADANKLIGFSKADTLEELVENGSDIEESQRAIENQMVKYVRTINRGYRLIFGDTRSVLNLNQ